MSQSAPASGGDSPKSSDAPAAETYRFADPPAAWAEPEPGAPTKPVQPGAGQSVQPAVGQAFQSAVGQAFQPATRRKRSARDDFWALVGYNLIVFMTSVCIMTLELTASRLLAKEVGSSLYTWTSVIGVVLAGITLGNFLGGWMADRFHRGRTLAWMFFAASAFCFSVLWLDRRVAEMSRPEAFSWPAWVLCVVALIFLLPFLTLGTMSPIVASMALSRSTKTGITVGNVYAWGALGSIIGTFITGFYLIDTLGTRAIVGLTSATLAVMGLLVAGGQRAFRAGVLFGWLQLVGFVVLAATATESGLFAAGHWFGRMQSRGASSTVTERGQQDWADYGAQLGRKFHELGLLLRLRDDDLGAYHDESSYSYIKVGTDFADGDTIKYLRLDKLMHSYYNPVEPTKLYYDYEKVYAAVTEVAAGRAAQAATVELAPFAGWDAIREKLPSNVHYDAATQQLRADGPISQPDRDALLALSPSAPYWEAVEEAYRQTNTEDWGGFASVHLEELPPETSIPRQLHEKIRHDTNLQALNLFEKLTRSDRDQLLAAAPHWEWHEAVRELWASSRRVSVLFIGGGGFIFPRWIETEYPHSERIEVAELDPAVKLAVQQELGLPPDDETKVKTTIGDARNFVDDRLRANERLKAQGEPPVRYDFIYGDAFNDFSVPFHLATLEFSEKVDRLLTPSGVFLQNIIDIYPRTEIPGEVRGRAETAFAGEFPEKLLGEKPRGNTWIAASGRFRGVEVRPSGVLEYELRYTGVMSDSQYYDLQNLSQDEDWGDAASQLYYGSREKVPLSTGIPAALIPEYAGWNIWALCPSPFEGVEIYRRDEQQALLGLRGAASDDLRDRLLQLAPNDAAFKAAIEDGVRRSRQRQVGGFLGRYVNTLARIFPNVYVFSSEPGVPHDDRDTFVIACSHQPLDFGDIAETGYWTGKPFAWQETPDGSDEPELHGQMASLLELAHDYILTDDFAPVDNLLKPVFAEQE